MPGTIIGYPNRTGNATLSGGSWEASLPLDNLKTRTITEVSRTTDATTASTKLQADFGSIKNFRTFALANHNLSADAMWRVKLGSTAGGSDVYDTGNIKAWQLSFDDVVEWESTTWWNEVAGDEYLRSQFAAIIILPDIYNARYITIEIDDTTNSDGYVQVGRLFCGSGIQFSAPPESINPIGWIDLSTVDMAESGALWTTERRRLRKASAVFPVATDEEAKWAFEIKRQVGTFREVLYLPFPDDLGANQQYGFLARIRQMSDIEFPFPKINRVPFVFEEIA